MGLGETLGVHFLLAKRGFSDAIGSHDMLFLLKKFVSFWLMPLPLSALLLSLGLLFLFWKKKLKLGRSLVLLGFGVLLVFGNKAVSRQLVSSLENSYPARLAAESASLSQDPELARCGYIMILGSGHQDAEELPAASRLSESARARLVEGVRLARLLPDAKVIVSGPAEVGGRTHASVLAASAVSLGLEPKRLMLIDTALDTESEAAQAKALVGDAPLALVTSAWHLPRAAALFQRQGMRVVPCPSDYLGQSPKPLRLSDYGWEVESLGRSTAAVHEYLGLLWQKLRGKG